MEKEWVVYLVECSDGTYYCGITKDIKKRVHAHNHTKKGARYTRKRRPVSLISHTKKMTRKEAASYERFVKSLKRDKKIPAILAAQKD